MAKIETGGRLIQQQHAAFAVLNRIRNLRKCAGKLHPLLLTARQHIVSPALKAAQANFRERPAGLVIRCARALRDRPHPHDFKRGEGKGKHRTLRQDGAKPGKLNR